jgi:hypothetical protein
MAARKQLWHDGATREKIQASMLIARLQDHIKGLVKMQPTQVQAALGLLRKVLPDLANIEYRDETVHTFVIEAPAVLSQDEWLASRGQGFAALEHRALPNDAVVKSGVVDVTPDHLVDVTPKNGKLD